MDDLEAKIARLPQAIEPEFFMGTSDERIVLAKDQFEISRDDLHLASLAGEVAVEWGRGLRVIIRGDISESSGRLAETPEVVVACPKMAFSAEALVISGSRGSHGEKAELLLRGVRNKEISKAKSFLFYLVNFPDFNGEWIRYGESSWGGGRLVLRGYGLTCTIDHIAVNSSKSESKSGGLMISHVGRVEKLDGFFLSDDIEEILDALHWFFSFLRGARCGPVLPCISLPFVENWIDLAPWKVGEMQGIKTWMPRFDRLDASSLLEFFMGRWKDVRWKEGLKHAISWYVLANSPTIGSEAKITLCQIALEVLADLLGCEHRSAARRIPDLLRKQRIPPNVPPRLAKLLAYASRRSGGSSECLIILRNLLEHPSAKNFRELSLVDGVTRAEAAWYGLELFELSLLSLAGYQGKYVARGSGVHAGDDEVLVPWANAEVESDQLQQ